MDFASWKIGLFTKKDNNIKQVPMYTIKIYITKNIKSLAVRKIFAKFSALGTNIMRLGFLLQQTVFIPLL